MGVTVSTGMKVCLLILGTILVFINVSVEAKSFDGDLMEGNVEHAPAELEGLVRVRREAKRNQNRNKNKNTNRGFGKGRFGKSRFGKSRMGKARMGKARAVGKARMLGKARSFGKNRGRR